MMEIHTEIVINAPRETVWSILTDFAAHADWNPFIVKIMGRARPGATIVFVAAMNGLKIPVVARIFNFEAGQRFSWGGPENRWIKAVVGAEHYFILETIHAQQCRMIHGEKMSGLVPTVLWQLMERSKPAYIAMNEALKRRAEQQLPQ